MSKKKKKNSKVNISLVLSVLAIVISSGQLIISSPFFMKYYNSTELIAVENSIAKHPLSNRIESVFLIKNIGENSAKEIELSLRTLHNDYVRFVPPDVFELAKSEKIDPVLPDLKYKCKSLVPNEEVRIIVSSSFEEYLLSNQLDTLLINRKVRRPNYQTGPFINYLKFSDGQAQLDIMDTLELREIQYVD